LWRAPRWTLAGVIAPLIMHSTMALLMMGIGLMAWLYLQHRWLEIGRMVSAQK